MGGAGGRGLLLLLVEGVRDMVGWARAGWAVKWERERGGASGLDSCAFAADQVTTGHSTHGKTVGTLAPPKHAAGPDL